MKKATIRKTRVYLNSRTFDYVILSTTEVRALMSNFSCTTVEGKLITNCTKEQVDEFLNKPLRGNGPAFLVG